MAQEHILSIPSFPTLRAWQKNRTIDVIFCTPDRGIDSTTGILLLVPGFGAHLHSKVYHKMRRLFADHYNLITIQCSYLGWQYMQSSGTKTVADRAQLDNLLSILQPQERDYVFEAGNLNWSRLLEIVNKIKGSIVLRETLSEGEADYLDFGLIQACDCVMAICGVLAQVRANDLSINYGKIIGYGHSHGAYIALLANAYIPGLFTHIIDNSAWIIPQYLFYPRILVHRIGLFTLQRVFKYELTGNPEVDLQIRSLKHLYQLGGNAAHILTFQGSEDKLVRPDEKQHLMSAISNAEFKLVTPGDVDGLAFTSAEHGLGADFLQLFQLGMNHFEKFDQVDDNPVMHSLENIITTNKATYRFSLNGGLPYLHVSNCEVI